MADITASSEIIDKQENSSYYEQMVQHPLFQQALSTYDWAKNSNPYITSTLDSVEQKVSTISQAATQKANETYDTYYVKPKNTFTEAYTSSKEKTQWAIDSTKNAAIHTGTVALGATVLAAQLGLQLSVGSANLVLDGAGAVTNAGKNAVNSVKAYEKAIEDKIWGMISEAQRYAKMPVDKASETTHSVLDVINALIERTLQINIHHAPDSSITARVKTIAHAVTLSLTNKAQEQVIDPVQEKTRILLEHLSKSFVLVDVVRSQKEWALEKVEELSASVSDLKSRLETEAKQYGTKPEEALMKFIKDRSNQLREQLETLKNKGQQIFGDGTRIESAIVYLQDLDSNLGQAEDIYQVRDEVLTEARQRLAELSQWTTSLFLRRQNQVVE